jgi:hypothetical protein
MTPWNGGSTAVSFSLTLTLSLILSPSLTRDSRVDGVITTELNSSTDNPLVFAEEADAVSAGNFHGASCSCLRRALVLVLVLVLLLLLLLLRLRRLLLVVERDFGLCFEPSRPKDMSARPLSCLASDQQLPQESTRPRPSITWPSGLPSWQR